MKTEHCETCGQRITTRKESLTKGLCLALLKFAKEVEFVARATLHIRKHQKNGARYFETAETTNFQKLQYFGLVRTSAAKSGHWYITESGIRFAKDQERIPKFVWVKNNEVVDVSKEQVRISQINGTPFWKQNY